jgi:peptide deformylase
MSVRKIITVPDKILRKISTPIEKIGNDEKKLIKDLFESMYHSNGIGLAAIQVGVPKRIIVLDISGKDEKKNPLCFINPTIKKKSEKFSNYEEGCLSIPDTFIEIERPSVCEVDYLNIDGKKNSIKCEGLLSTCIQHEIAHCDGELIIDYLSKLKKDMVIKKLSKKRNNPDRIVV